MSKVIPFTITDHITALSTVALLEAMAIMTERIGADGDGLDTTGGDQIRVLLNQFRSQVQI